jgi:hypothetical protein
MRTHQVLRIVLATLIVGASSFGQQASLASLPAAVKSHRSVPTHGTMATRRG